MKSEIQTKIIDFIRRNKVSTTEVADCLGKTGALKGIYPINRGHFKVGRVKWVYAYDNSNYPVHEQIIDTQEGDIVFIEAFDCGDRAIIGDLVSKYLLLYRQSQAIICNSYFRDAADLIKENYPIWCKGFNPVGCFNVRPSYDFPEDKKKEHAEKYEGSIAVCDDCGVVIIPKDEINHNFYQRLIAIEEQEDIWYDRLDHFKENTFEIVCLKKYLLE